jgi:stage II sporulation protein P
VIFIIVLFFLALGRDYKKPETTKFSAVIREQFLAWSSESLLNLFSPSFSFVNQENTQLLQIYSDGQMKLVLPLYQYVQQNTQLAISQEDPMTVEMILLAEAEEEDHLPRETQDGIAQNDTTQNDKVQNNTVQNDSAQNDSVQNNSVLDDILRNQTDQSIFQENESDLAALFAAENRAEAAKRQTESQENAPNEQSDSQPDAQPQQTVDTNASVFVPRLKVDTLDMSSLSDYETLVKSFYTIDSTTMIGSDQLNAELLSNRNLTITKDQTLPQILIFHTHYNESFADSIPGDPSTGIVGVGDQLTRILEEDYGFNVIHYTGEYDMQAGPDAYSGALPIMEQILKENPSIQVVLDVHRDAAGEGDHLVMDLDGKPTAQFMFFNGLSRTRKTGNIAYLYNENLESNLAFSFQLQTKALEYYPGLARKIYLKAYRYNMHLSPRYALVEMGAQNNTVEEVMNACYPLAHILDMVLEGKS